MECYDELRRNGHVCVEAIVLIGLDGKMTPLKIKWATGEVFIIDKVKKVERAIATSRGGMGDRYTCIIRGKETHLFHGGKRGEGSGGVWFVEAKR